MITESTVALKIFLNVLMYALQFVVEQSLARMNMENVLVYAPHRAGVSIAR